MTMSVIFYHMTFQKKLFVAFRVDIISTELICVFVFAYAKSWFSHGAAHIWSLISAIIKISLVLEETLKSIKACHTELSLEN